MHGRAQQPEAPVSCASAACILQHPLRRSPCSVLSTWLSVSSTARAKHQQTCRRCSQPVPARRQSRQQQQTAALQGQTAGAHQRQQLQQKDRYAYGCIMGRNHWKFHCQFCCTMPWHGMALCESLRDPCTGGAALVKLCWPARCPCPPQAISSSTSDTSSADNVVGHVLIDGPEGAKGGVQDLEAGHGLERAASGRGLALPFSPMAVAFKDISYFVPHPGVSGGNAAAASSAGAGLQGCCLLLPAACVVRVCQGVDTGIGHRVHQQHKLHAWHTAPQNMYSHTQF